MAFFRFPLDTKRPRYTSQPRLLSARERSQPCTTERCRALAVSEYKDKTYCADHLFKALRQSWQE